MRDGVDRARAFPAGDDYVVTRINETRDEERADVTGPADDDNSHPENVHLVSCDRQRSLQLQVILCA